MTFPPYPALPPKRDNVVWIIVLVVVLAITIPAILAGVLYVMVSGLISVPGTQKPFVTFGGITKVNALTWTFSVASASPAVAPSNYKINFGLGGTVGTAVNMGMSGQNVSVTTGSFPATVGLEWTDLGGENTVNAGDLFTITFPSVPTAGTALSFYLLYADGSQIQSLTWQA
jgi:hypothetical protein